MKTIQQIDKLILDGNPSKLNQNDIMLFLDEHWLEYACGHNLSPCGDLTLKGKIEYFESNLGEIQELIREFPSHENVVEKRNA
jgi:hypothetical protein